MEVERYHFNGFGHLDGATAALVLELQSRDIEELLGASKGKGRDGDLTDAELAITTYQQELDKSRTVLADQCMSRSLTTAVISDEALLQEALDDENAAASDRALARRMAAMDDQLDVATQMGPLFPQNAGYIASVARKTVFGDDTREDSIFSDNTATPESSAFAAKRQRPSDRETHSCVSCDAVVPGSDVFRAPCKHPYCRDCLHTLFELSSSDEKSFPPRCCRQEISIQSAMPYLSPILMQTLEKKSTEFKSSKRTYCSKPDCSTFIDPAFTVGDRAMCTACGTRTCTICKSAAHEGDCPKDKGTQQVLETARVQRWQRCYRCRTMVELELGCNHI